MRYRDGLDLLNGCEDKNLLGRNLSPVPSRQAQEHCQGNHSLCPTGDANRGHFFGQDIPLSRGLGSY